MSPLATSAIIICIMQNEWDDLIIQASEIVSTRENYQRVLGKLAFTIAEKYGTDKLEDFSRDLKEGHGLSLSPSTLRNYLWVYQKTSNLELPEDLSYRTLQYIASSDNPENWAKRIKEEGLSSAEVFRLIREEKGLDTKKRKVVCPDCGVIFEI